MIGTSYQRICENMCYLTCRIFLPPTSTCILGIDKQHFYGTKRALGNAHSEQGGPRNITWGPAQRPDQCLELPVVYQNNNRGLMVYKENAAYLMYSAVEQL